ncbi:hypothetical protein [Acinetobacter johnsonii]|uniref:hypothetical protein n=1 Tax=Acinetobacter johnsonii TaxID=40214 RepID=UPI0029366B87|nr:hypothetical protein [Acinetobacter johnsonii]MDV2486780.1 hypothetical protein [Acinetobacter johnsonii]MDV2486790.1 hypothetical protein [Acinetobacter johnsonii]
MDVIEYFNERADQVLNSKTFDEARDHLAFYFGAYHFAENMGLLAGDFTQIKESLTQLSEFVASNWENDE